MSMQDVRSSKATSASSTEATFPLYIVGGGELTVVNSKKEIVQKFEEADFKSKGNVGSEAFDSSFRVVKIKQAHPLVYDDVKIYVDSSESLESNRIWFKYLLIEICVFRKELGLYSEEAFCLPLEVLLRKICEALGYKV